MFIYDTVSHIFGIYPKKTKTLIRKNICIPLFIAAFFIITRIWKQPKCPPVDEWIKKLWDLYTMEYYSAIKIIQFYLL